MYSPPPDDVISQEYVFKLIPKITDILKEVREDVEPETSEKRDPLKLEIKPSSSDDDSELSYISNNEELLQAYVETIEEEVDPSLRLEANEEEESEPNHGKIDPKLHLGITLFVGAIILIIILIGLIKGR
jgi:hypothetical protein